MHVISCLALASAGLLLSLTSCQNPAPQPTARSITVFPVVLANQANADVATVVGSLLERGGMPEVDVAEATFTPAAGQDFAAHTQAFAAFVRDYKLSSERALFVDIQGTRQTGIEQVRSVLVDNQGKVLWSERQQAGDAAFDRHKPKEPLDCCIFVVQRLCEPLGLADPLRDGAPQGKLGARMQSKAGVPTAAETEAMAQRLQAVRKLGVSVAIRVLPPRIGGQWSAEGASDLAKRLVAAGFTNAQAAPAAIDFRTERSSNEQAVLWSGAHSLQQAVRAAPPGADHLLATDFLMAGEGKVGAVHCYLLSPAGDLVWVDYQNSHHDDFQRVNPRDAAGCCELAAKRVAQALRP